MELVLPSVGGAVLELGFGPIGGKCDSDYPFFTDSLYGVETAGPCRGPYFLVAEQESKQRSRPGGGAELLSPAPKSRPPPGPSSGAHFWWSVLEFRLTPKASLPPGGRWLGEAETDEECGR